MGPVLLCTGPNPFPKEKTASMFVFNNAKRLILSTQ